MEGTLILLYPRSWGACSVVQVHQHLQGTCHALAIFMSLGHRAMLRAWWSQVAMETCPAPAIDHGRVPPAPPVGSTTYPTSLLYMYGRCDGLVLPLNLCFRGVGMRLGKGHYHPGLPSSALASR